LKSTEFKAVLECLKIIEIKFTALIVKQD